MASLQKRLNKGHYYWYIVESRRIKGKPTPIPICYLGTVDKILEKFTNKEDSKSSSKCKYNSFSHGAVFTMWEMAKKLGVIKILDSVFPEGKRCGLSKGESILLAAIHRAIEPGSKREFSEWVKTTTLPSISAFDPKKLTSQHFWAQMDGITEKMLMEAEDKLTKVIFDKYNFSTSKIALDYTNYFTYIDTTNKKSTLSKRGHNKQRRTDLRQFSLALFTTKEAMLPLCSYVYEGNINDVTIFPEYFKVLKERIMKYEEANDITVVFDKGSVSKENLNVFDTPDCRFNYICSFSLKSCKELISIPLANYKEISVGNKKLLHYRIKKIIWGKERECILVFSQNLKDGQIRGFQSDLNKKIEELNQLKLQLKNQRSTISKKKSDIQNRVVKIIKNGSFSDIIKVDYIGKRIVKDIQFDIDEIAIQDVYSDYGKKNMITNKSEWSTEEILEAYLDQNDIETIFKDSKNPKHFAIKPQFHWTDSKVRVHTFCCLLGLTLTALLKKELLDKGIKIENDKILEILGQIDQIYILNPNKKKKSGFDVDKQLEEMTTIQTEIWTKLHSSF